VATTGFRFDRRRGSMRGLEYARRRGSTTGFRFDRRRGSMRGLEYARRPVILWVSLRGRRRDPTLERAPSRWSCDRRGAWIPSR
jgi:hypothetical protein